MMLMGEMFLEMIQTFILTLAFYNLTYPRTFNGYKKMFVGAVITSVNPVDLGGVSVLGINISNLQM